MNVRAATLDEVPAIRAIALATWPVAYGEILSPAQLAYMLDLMYSEPALVEQMTVKGHRFLIAEGDGRIIGFASFEHGYDAKPSTRLHKLYVLPDSKGTGTGKAVLHAVADAARASGDTRIELNVNRFNPAKDWYLNHGFRIERDEVIDIGQGHVMDDHVMVRPFH